MQTLGRHHPLLRRLRALRRDRAAREREAVFVAEGPHLAEEALAAGAPIELALVAAGFEESPVGRPLVERLNRSGIPIHAVPAERLSEVTEARSAQPIALLVRRRAPRGLEARLAALGDAADAALVVVAWGVQDPGNLGALLRTADAAGADLFGAGGEGADPFHPRAVRASAGSVFRIAPEACRLEDVARLRERGLRCLATAPRGGRDPASCDLTGAMAVLLGAEGAGLPAPLLALADARVTVPLRAGVESLSVGAAAAVVLFEAARQRARGGAALEGEV